MRRRAVRSSARVDVEGDTRLTGRVTTTGEPIMLKEFRMVGNCARFWKRCLELYFAKVICDAVLGLIGTGCVDLFHSVGTLKPLGSVGCEEVSRNPA